MLAANNPASIALRRNSSRRPAGSSPVSSICCSCGQSSLRTNSRVVRTISSCSSLSEKSIGAPPAADRSRRRNAWRLVCLSVLVGRRSRQRLQCPSVQELELQAQLLELSGRGPVALARHRARSNAVDEGYDRPEHLLARGRGQLRPVWPAFCQAALEEPHVLAMHPGIDAPQTLVGRNLTPESRPEGALDVALLIDREGFGQYGEEVGGILAGRPRQALLDPAQDQPQRGDDDVLLGVEVMRDHASRVTGLARNPHDRRLIEAVLGDHPAGDEGDLVAALVMIDDLRHVAVSAGRPRAGARTQALAIPTCRPFSAGTGRCACASRTASSRACTALSIGEALPAA